MKMYWELVLREFSFNHSPLAWLTARSSFIINLVLKVIPVSFRQIHLHIKRVIWGSMSPSSLCICFVRRFNDLC
jgi:hypothetical protein